MTNPIRFFCLLILLPIGATLIAGCQPIVRERTLPPSIRTISVPMAFNRTAEPAFEEYLTIAVQEEFDYDGRLKRARRTQDADAIIRIFITDWDTSTFALDADGFPVAQEHAVRVHIHIFENIPGLPMIGEPRVVDEIFIFHADPRATTFDPEPRRRDQFARALARSIVMEVITGEFEGLDDPPRSAAPIVVQ